MPFGEIGITLEMFDKVEEIEITENELLIKEL